MTTTSTPCKVEAINIGKVFVTGDSAGKVEALRDIDLRIDTCEFVSFVGASGCGKTTFLRIVDGLIQPTSGTVRLDGSPVTGPGHNRGFVFQADALLPWRTVLDNVALGLEAQGNRRGDARDIAKEYLRLVGMAEFEELRPLQISGGMRQRVNLARALAISPDVLLMDEPFASLDAQTREIMQSELLKIWSQQQKTVLFVTHQIDEAVYLSDKVVVLTSRPGRIKEIIEVDIPRPRPLSIKRTPGFVEIVDRVWKLIEEEVIQGMRAQSQGSAGTP